MGHAHQHPAPILEAARRLVSHIPARACLPDCACQSFKLPAGFEVLQGPLVIAAASGRDQTYTIRISEFNPTTSTVR